MYDSRRTQVFQFMTPAGVKYVNMYESCRSQVSPCMTPTRVKLVSLHRPNWCDMSR